MVELGVVEAVQEVDRPRAGGCHADADLVRELRVAARHERGHLLVARLDELGVGLRPVERAEEPVDPVARVAVDAVDAPLAETLEDEVGNELGHDPPFACFLAACSHFTTRETENRSRRHVAYGGLIIVQQGTQIGRRKMSEV